MTKNEAVCRLKDIKGFMASMKDYKDLSSFQYFSLIHEEALLEVAIKNDVDPDSVYFAYEIEEGKGKKWDVESRLPPGL